MNIKIAICDDENAIAVFLESIIKKWASKRGILAETILFPSAESFWFHYSEDDSIDVLFLDIQMGKEDGMTLAHRIRTHSKQVEIIFVTGFTDYVFDGYSVSALNYILKPVKENKIAETLDRALSKITAQKQKPSLLISADGSVRIFQNDILYIEAMEHTVDIYVKVENGDDKKYTVKKSISSIKQELDEFLFCQTHRSYIVGINHMAGITKTDVLLDNGAKVPLSRRNFKTVNEAFIRFFKGGANV